MIDSNTPTISFPAGRIAGCLPRRSLPGAVCPLAAERIKVIPRGEWPALAAAIGGGQGLKPFVKTILDQGNVGSCATEATAGAAMISRAFAGARPVLLNPWYIYHHTSHGRDNGSSIDENLEFAREHGIAPEEVWPRAKGWRAEPSEEAKVEALKYRLVEFYDVQSIDEMVSCLLQGFPVVHGANGHAVCSVRHIDQDQGEDLNSWGTDWGEGGFGVWAAYRAINWQYGAWAVRTTMEA